MEKILAFVDLLGFSRMVEKDYQRAREVLNDFYNISFNTIKNNNNVQGSLFSDSLLAYSSSYSSLINCLTEIYRKCLRKNNQYLDLQNFFILPRGAISVGFVNIEDRQTSPNLTKDFIVSPALVHSAKLEESIKGSRLLIAINNSDPHQISHLQFSDKIKSVLYENTTFTFWSNYKYHDSLWFLDLNKDGKSQRKELKELLDIAFRLVSLNRQNSATIDQYINTLRVGLLSYSKFLDREQDEILEKIINEYQDDEFWLIWLTAIEMILYSGEEWKYAVNGNFISFFKNSSLNKGWRNLIEEINKPEQEDLKQKIQFFLREMFSVQL